MRLEALYSDDDGEPFPLGAWLGRKKIGDPLARERGQEWGSLSDEQREELIDVILHE